MTAERDGLDPAAVLAEHEGDHFCHGSGPVRKWYIPGLSPHCPPYRLAALAVDLQGKVARIEALRPERVVFITRHSDDMVAWWRLTAALADRPEQV